ncbi:DUF2079 domain-containing protein [Streptomyces hydrogenans]|uniref:DUF2079 domain-containing protein n=1 Tax=Streptomyces hydrogenans TaxID=1873719 RepID=UPI0037FBD0E6
MICCAIGLQSWATLRVAGFDLGIFDQAIRAYSHFDLPRSSIKSVHHEFPPSFTLLGDHFTPVLALLAPLYWLWDDPRVLIFAQSALFAFGVLPARRIARRCFSDTSRDGGEVAVNVSGLVYALGWPLLNSAYSGFHEVAFATPVILMMLERGMASRYRSAAAWALLLCAVKEDMGLVVGLFGVLLAVRSHRVKEKRGRTVGLVLAVTGPLVAALTIGWFLPHMGSPKGYYWSYGRLGADAGEAIANTLTAPWILFEVAFTPSIKVVMLAWILGTLALLPIGSTTFLLAVPLLAERMLSDNPNHWVVINHYDAFLWPILFVASLETLERLRKFGAGWEKSSRRTAIAAVALSSAASVFLGLSLLVNPSHWRASPDKQALIEAANLIPDGVTVEADNAIAPRLTKRTKVVIADETPRGSEWVLLRAKDRTFPFGNTEDQKQRIALLLDHGYVEMWEKDGATLLHRVKNVPIPGSGMPGADSVPVREKVPEDVGRSAFLR